MTRLDLSTNKFWFGDGKATELLCAFIKDQAALKKLQMSDNDMSSIVTEQVLSALLESGSITTIETIFIDGADYSSDKACTLLYHLIDRAHKLDACYISPYSG